MLTNVPADAIIMQDEPFAPVVGFQDPKEALAMANSTNFGLASCVFASNLRIAYLAGEGIKAGMVGVNTMLIATAEALRRGQAVQIGP